MKLIILIIALVLVAGCGGGKKDVGKDELIDLQTDVVARQTANGPVIEFTFYHYTIGPSNGNLVNVTGKTIVEVENPSFNGVAMTREADPSGQPYFKVGGNTAKPVNEISASFNGRTYLGNAVVSGRPNAMTRVTMYSPK